MKILRVLALGAALSTALVFTASAGAATTIGSKCVSNNGAPATLFTTSTSNGESYVVPFNGIMTQWGTDATYAGSNDGVLAAVLGAATGSGSDWKLSAVTPFAYLPGGTGAVSFSARVAVVSGQTLGITNFHSSGSVAMCATSNPADAGVYGEAFGVGEVFPTSSISTYKAPVWATIEADADGDGYGDESQDKCPQSAAWQNACPVLAIGQQVTASSTEIKILASTTVDASITATATVTIASKTKATLKSKATAFTAGKLKTIKLKLPTSVKNALKKKSLKATVTLSGNGLANSATKTSKITLKKKQ